jgi:hypothetical protein
MVFAPHKKYGKELLALLTTNSLKEDIYENRSARSDNRRYLANNQYEFACQNIDEAGRMIGGWQKSAV